MTELFSLALYVVRALRPILALCLVLTRSGCPAVFALVLWKTGLLHLGGGLFLSG